ncbi:MAG: hypothetical protein [Enterobacteria phage RP5]|nr:MAG: hypothetical protein [Enterobacteria phage RP5]
MKVCSLPPAKILSLLTATPVTITMLTVSPCNHFNCKVKQFQP